MSYMFSLQLLFFRLCHLCRQLVPYSPLKISHAVTELMMKGVLADGGTTLLQKL